MRGDLVEDGCHVLHVEVEDLPVQVAVAHRPELSGFPVVVHVDGTVLDASAAARAAGVAAGEPLDAALARCRGAVPVPADPDAHARVAAGLLDVLTELTPLVERVGPAAAFVDVAGALRRHGSPARIAWLVRDRVRARHGVSCAVGVAATKVVARLAGRAAGPDGVLLVPRAASARFLRPLPVTVLPEVEGTVEAVLAEHGINALGELASASPAGVRRVLGPVAARRLQDLAWGRDPRPVVPVPRRAEVDELRVETPCADAGGDRGRLERSVRVLAREGAALLRAQGRSTRRVDLVTVTADGAVLTLSRALATPTRGEHELHLVTRSLLAGTTWTAVPETLRLVLGALDAPRSSSGADRAAGRPGDGDETGPEAPADAPAGARRGARQIRPARVTLVRGPSTTTIVTADIS
ncbi:DNA polymerase Y family protein [Cellulomonas telluris]|uniref:DNA polymerase Y family protein n=1 Tax=Cellulomonas telluris TaxID=2306636 RepID=UPI0014562D5C|nr:DNA polymerase IV [Cellulomonas telluris]